MRLLEKAGEIHDLVLQPSYPLEAAQHEKTLRPCVVSVYRGDFEYCECRRGDKCERTQLVLEDVKGFKTPVYRMKKKHVMAQYGIEIREV